MIPIQAYQLIPSRVKYYLLDFKDTYYQRFYERYKKVAVKDLTLKELADMLEWVSNCDEIKILNENESKTAE